MIGLLLAFYPAQWRQRYGEEFRAVLESRPLGPFDVADVFLGAIDARLSPRRLPGSAGINGGPQMLLRIGGVGAIAGGFLWFLSLAAASFADGDNDSTWLALGALGTLGLLLALVGLSAFQAYRHPILAWAGFAIPGLGTVLAVIGLIGMATGSGDNPNVGPFNAWSVWMIGMLGTVVGSIFFAMATIRARVFSRRAAQALATSSIIFLVGAFGLAGGGAEDLPSRLVTAVVLGSFAASWMALGVMALRRGPIRAVAPA
jgi:hypothetical protein